MAEFALVTALLLVLTLGLVQLAVYLHVRNMAADAASNGARVAALADGTAQDGVTRARDLAAQALGARAVGEVRASEHAVAGGVAVTVTVSVKVPVLGLVPGPTSHEASAVATRFL